MMGSQGAWRTLLIGVLGVGIAGCKDDSDGATAGDDGSAMDGDSDAGTQEGDDGAEDDDGCIPGGLGCSCADGVCTAELYCVQDTCVQGPDVQFDQDYPDVLAGLRIPVDVDANGDTIEWSQTAGPAVELLSTKGLTTEVSIPADVADGATFTLKAVVSLNGVSVEGSIDITIRSAEFSNVFPDVVDPQELGTTDGLAFNKAGMWVVSNEGFVSQMSPGDDDHDEPIAPGFVQRIELGGIPTGANFVDDELLLVANAMPSAVQTVATTRGTVGTYFDQIDGGAALGAANFVLPDRNDGAVLLSNGLDGKIIHHDPGDPDDDDPVPPSTIVLGDAPGTNPNAMAFGPEGAGILYLGVEGAILRVPYGDGMLGQTSTYLDLSGCTQPDGLIFDEGGNMWVGCSDTNTLHVARYVAGDGSTTVERMWTDVGPGISRFANLQFGDGNFGDRALYWTNLEDGTVGTLGVGLRERNR